MDFVILGTEMCTHNFLIFFFLGLAFLFGLYI